jgi:hypothetical protein
MNPVRWPGRNPKVRRQLAHFADVPGGGSRKSVEGLRVRAGKNIGLRDRIRSPSPGHSLDS